MSGAAGDTRWYNRPLVALGCLLAGLVVAVGYVHTHRGAPAAAKVHSRLVDRVHDADRGADDLGGRVATLERQVAAERNAALAGGSEGTLAQQLRAAQLQAGQVAVRGPGMTVTLRDPSGPSPSGVTGRAGSVPITATHILTDRDVRSVVNELWHDGAEAVAVNGVRLTPTSAIRFAGEAVLVDFRPITSPYRMSAIGDTDNLSTSFAQSSVASRYQTRESVQGIGFSFTESTHVQLPAGAPAAVRHAPPNPSRTRGPR